MLHDFHDTLASFCSDHGTSIRSTNDPFQSLRTAMSIVKRERQVFPFTSTSPRSSARSPSLRARFGTASPQALPDHVTSAARDLSLRAVTRGGCCRSVETPQRGCAIFDFFPLLSPFLSPPDAKGCDSSGNSHGLLCLAMLHSTHVAARSGPCRR